MKIVLDNMNEELFWCLNSLLAKSLGEIDFDVDEPEYQEDLKKIKLSLDDFHKTKIDGKGIFSE